MKCFNCDEEITPEMSIEPTLEGNVNVACFCVECGVTINLFFTENQIAHFKREDLRCCGNCAFGGGSFCTYVEGAPLKIYAHQVCGLWQREPNTGATTPDGMPCR